MPILDFVNKPLIPENSLLGQDKYSTLIKKVKDFLTEKGYRFKQISPYLVEISTNGENSKTIGLQNLERRLIDVPTKDWHEKIKEFFNILSKKIDYELIAEKSPEEFINSLRIKYHLKDEVSKFWENSIYSDDLPDVRGVISYDCKEYVVSVNKQVLENIDIPLEELKEIAFKNTIKNSKILNILPVAERESVTVFTGDDYVGAHLFEKSAEWKDLRFGKLIAFPSKHVFATLDITDSIIEDLSSFIGLTLNMYATEVGPISENLYWSYKGKYYLLEVSLKDDRVVFTPHQKFMDKVLHPLGVLPQ